MESKLPPHESLEDASSHIQLTAIVGWWAREEKATNSGKGLGELRGAKGTPRGWNHRLTQSLCEEWMQTSDPLPVFRIRLDAVLLGSGL